MPAIHDVIGGESPEGGTKRLRVVRRVVGDTPAGFAVIVGMTVLFTLGLGVVAPVLPMFTEELGLSNAEAALLLSSFALGRMVFTLPAGPITDRFRFRSIAVASSCVLTLSMALAWSAESFLLLLVSQAVAGMASVQFTMAAMTTLVERAPRHAVGRLLGAFQGTIVLVVAFAPMVGGISAGVLGVKGPFVVSAGGGLIAIGCAITMLGRGPAQVVGGRDTGSPTSGAGGSSDSLGGALGKLSSVVKQPAFVLALVAGFATTWSLSGVRNTLVPLFAADELRMSGSQIGIMLTVAGLANVVGMVSSGHALDAVGRRPVLRLGMAAVGLSATAFVLVQSVVPAFVVLCAMGLARGGLAPVPAVVVADVAADSSRGSALAVNRMGAEVGLTVGPAVAGFVSDAYSLRTSFLVSGVVLCCLAIVTWRMPETGSRKIDC